MIDLSVWSSTDSAEAARRLAAVHIIAMPPALELAQTRTAVDLIEVSATSSSGAERSDEEYDQEDSLLDYSESYYITGELPGGYWLRAALPVQVRLEGSEFVAVQPLLGLHAFGVTSLDAILALRDRLAEHYADLENMASQLAPRLRYHLSILRQVIVSQHAEP